MQNLSLSMSQTTSQKKMDGSADKTNMGLDKPVAGQNASFRMVLSKQVQSQQTPNKQTPDKQTPVQQEITQSDKAQQVSAKVTEDNYLEATMLQPKRKLKAINSQHDIAVAIKAELEAKNINPNIQDSSAIVLSAAALVPLLNTQVTSTTNEPKLTSQLASQLTFQPSTQTATTVENVPDKQYELDAMLNNTEFKFNKINTLESPAIAPKTPAESLVNTDKIGQIAVTLPTIAKPSAVDESSNVSWMFSTLRESMAADAAINEVLTPAGLPSLVQVNTALPTQQVASANMISAYPGKAGWDQAISQKVVWMVGAGEQSATLTLNPPDLGPLQVVIHVHNNQADTTFISNNAEVRQALQDGMANLRDKMSESGLQLGQANVSSGQQSQQPFQQAMQERQAPQLTNVNTVLATEKATDANAIVRIANGLVDTFA